MTAPVTVVHPAAGPFRAEVSVPGDKSLSHRALILSAMALGRSEIVQLGPGADVRSTISALRRLGVEIGAESVESSGAEAWSDPNETLDCGNSATTMRLLTGALAAQPFRTTLDGDASLRQRPMERLSAPLAALGARVEVAPGGRPPIITGGSSALAGCSYELPIASAQVRSAFELAAVQADGESTIDSPGGFRDHTERWLETLGLGRRMTETRFQVTPGPVPPARFIIPGDPSSAAFLWASAALVAGSSVTTPRVSLNPGRLGFLQIMERMGCGIEAEVTGETLGDPMGTVTVFGHPLAATRIHGLLTATALDELPLVAVLAAFAEGETTVEDASELRTKESDRITATVAMIRALGGGAEETTAGFHVVGTGRLTGGQVDARGDHRIAMASAVAATAADGPVQIEFAEAAAVSWPGFYEALEAAWSSP